MNKSSWYEQIENYKPIYLSNWFIKIIVIIGGIYFKSYALNNGLMEKGILSIIFMLNQFIGIIIIIDSFYLKKYVLVYGLVERDIINLFIY